MAQRDGQDAPVPSPPDEKVKLGQVPDANIFTSADGSAASIPIGSIRCYWTVLDDDLRFVYIDPLLREHMRSDADKLVGSSIYDFIHPDERESAKVDLDKSAYNHPSQPASRAMEAKGSGASSQGSSAAASPAGASPAPRRKWEYGGVTRCRFARVSKARKLLGTEDAPLVDPEVGSVRVPSDVHVAAANASKAPKYTVNDEYMSMKMVMSSIGVNLVLCFFHAAQGPSSSFSSRLLPSPYRGRQGQGGR